MSDSDRLADFRPRIGKRVRARERVASSSFRVATLVRRGHGGFRASRALRVAPAPEGFGPRPNARRVIVKAHVQRLTRFGAQAAARHLGYIERDGVEKDGSKGELYGPEGPVERERFEQPRVDERHQFRFIVSPEDGRDLELTGYVRQLMARVQRDLGRPLEWAAVNHHDTEHPHAHIVVRGVDLEGRALRIQPAYIARGFRWSAQDLATELLGPRLEIEIRRTREQEVTKERFTSLDRELERGLSGRQIDVKALHQGPDADAALLVRRLEQLRKLGLARPVTERMWELADGWQAQLRELGERGDILKQMHRALDGGDPVRFHVVRRGQGVPDGHGGVDERAHVGRVVRKGLEDEHKGTFYVVLETPTGKAYHMPISARAVDTLNVGDLVSFRTQREPAVEQTPESPTQRENGRREMPVRYRLVLERFPLSLEAQVGHRGPVWLDKVDPRSLAQQGLGADVHAAIMRRRQALLELGIGPNDPQRDAKLLDIERRAVGKEFSRQTGQHFLESAPIGFRGRVQAGPERTSYVAISDGKRFVLVPATRETRALAGQTVHVSRDAQGRLLVRPSRDLDRGR